MPPAISSSDSSSSSEDQTPCSNSRTIIAELKNGTSDEDHDEQYPETASKESEGEICLVVNSGKRSSSEISSLPILFRQAAGILGRPTLRRLQNRTVRRPTFQSILGRPTLRRLQNHTVRCPIFQRRQALPSHYLLKIESFPSLSKASIESCSSEFEAGGYKWELSIYPNGDKKNGGQDHISVLLKLLSTDSLPVGWEVTAIFTFFVFDQIRDEYVTFQDAVARVKSLRFHSTKTNWGIPKFIDLKTFSDPSNGYLVNGTCTFGAEVFVLKNTFKGECLSAIEEPHTCMHTWKVDSFSSMHLESYQSDLFVGGDYKWRILLYPNGIGEGKGNSLSLFLQLDISTLPPNTKLFVAYALRLRHQITGKHFERKASNVFSSSSGWGFRQFMSLSKFGLPENGYLVGDTCMVEAQFEVVGLIKRD